MEIKKDAALTRLIRKETDRQQNTLDLIASENIVSSAVRDILGSPLGNKYAEGYPGKRYYPGCEYYDAIERLAQQRALRLFRLNPRSWTVNVQPYSGTPANLAIYAALLDPGDTLMGLSLAHGGHLSHGHKASLSGKWYRAVQYEVNPQSGRLDYSAIDRLARTHRPRIIVSGASAYPRIIDFKKMGAIAKRVGAYHLADISHIAGLVAAGCHPAPFSASDAVITTTHKTLRGPRGAIIFSRTLPLRKKSGTTIAEAIDRAVFPGMQGGPHNATTAAMAQAFFEADTLAFRRYQNQVVANARTLSHALMHRGFTIATGGTDNHLLLIDLKTLGGVRQDEPRGRAIEQSLEQAGILVTRSALPGDTSPYNPTGLRLGTPSLTTRGMKEKEMEAIADVIARVVVRKELPRRVKKESQRLCKKFPVK